jgi:septal ring factor EnvC (AmiA/AmiB activator)
MAKTEQTETATITAPEAAKKIGTDPKLFRRFLRSDASPISAVGQGARYALDPKQIPALKKSFEKWQKDQEAKRTAREAEKAKSDEKPADEKPKPERTKDIVDNVKDKLAASHREGKHPSNKVPSCPECAKTRAEEAASP